MCIAVIFLLEERIVVTPKITLCTPPYQFNPSSHSKQWTKVLWFCSAQPQVEQCQRWFLPEIFFLKQIAYDKESELSINTHTTYLGKNIIAIQPILCFCKMTQGYNIFGFKWSCCQKVHCGVLTYSHRAVIRAYSLNQSYGDFICDTGSVVYVVIQEYGSVKNEEAVP